MRTFSTSDVDYIETNPACFWQSANKPLTKHDAKIFMLENHARTGSRRSTLAQQYADLYADGFYAVQSTPFESGFCSLSSENLQISLELGTGTSHPFTLSAHMC